jgi:hypothetical protein
LPDGDLGLNGLPLADLPLYGAERLGASPLAVVCEGEKAVQSLLDRGVPALGTTCGASSTPGQQALELLTGRTVYLWPDNDPVGLDHMRRILDVLHGIAADVLWLDWPDAPEHGDAADYIADPWRLINDARWNATLAACETVRACRGLYGPAWADELPGTIEWVSRWICVDIIEAGHDPLALAAVLDGIYGVAA